MHLPKVPVSCEHLDLALVERVLAKHHAFFPAAARELGVLPTDLRRLTWARPHLLDEAHEEMELFVARAMGELIKALYSPNDRRREWAAERILSSWIARDHPFARAPRGAARAQSGGAVNFTFRWGEPSLEKPPD